MNINPRHTMFFKNYYKSFFIILAILALSLFPTYEPDKIPFLNIPHFDKVVHFGMYFTLSFFLIIDCYNITKKPIKNYFLSVLLFVFIFSGLIEIIQDLFIPGRFGSVYDFFANIFGSLVGLYASFQYLKKRS